MVNSSRSSAVAVSAASVPLSSFFHPLRPHLVSHSTSSYSSLPLFYLPAFITLPLSNAFTECTWRKRLYNRKSVKQRGHWSNSSLLRFNFVFSSLSLDDEDFLVCHPAGLLQKFEETNEHSVPSVATFFLLLVAESKSLESRFLLFVIV